MPNKKNAYKTGALKKNLFLGNFKVCTNISLGKKTGHDKDCCWYHKRRRFFQIMARNSSSVASAFRLLRYKNNGLQTITRRVH